MKATLVLAVVASLSAAVGREEAAAYRSGQKTGVTSYDALLRPVVTVTPHGTYAVFEISASSPANVLAWVSETAPLDCCQFPPGSDIISPIPLPPPPKKKVTINVGSLTPQKKYYYIVRASYDPNKSGFTTGSFLAGVPGPKVAGWTIHGTSAVLHLERPSYISKDDVYACLDEQLPPAADLKPGGHYGQCDSSAGHFASDDITMTASAIHIYFKYLQPNTAYYYDVLFHHPDGKVRTRGGPIRTKRRIVEVSFDRITVYENSDNQDDAELLFTFWVNGKPLAYFQHETDDGEKLYPNVKVQVSNDDKTVNLEVGVADSDGCVMGHRDVRLIDIPGFPCNDMGATGEVPHHVGPVENTTTFKPVPYGLEEYERSFNFDSVYSTVNFRVVGRIRVRYGL